MSVTHSDALKQAAVIQQISEFGQTPKQLFLQPHPARGRGPAIPQAPPSLARTAGDTGVAHAGPQTDIKAASGSRAVDTEDEKCGVDRGHNRLGVCRGTQPHAPKASVSAARGGGGGLCPEQWSSPVSEAEGGYVSVRAYMHAQIYVHSQRCMHASESEGECMSVRMCTRFFVCVCVCCGACDGVWMRVCCACVSATVAIYGYLHASKFMYVPTRTAREMYVRMQNVIDIIDSSAYMRSSYE